MSVGPAKHVLTTLMKRGPLNVEALFQAVKGETIPTKTYMKQQLLKDLKRKDLIRARPASSTPSSKPITTADKQIKAGKGVRASYVWTVNTEKVERYFAAAERAASTPPASTPARTPKGVHILRDFPREQ
ncbi:hypothetical protein AMAG_05081 [Allomyces macrogynus ATCC 38327]|uniref:Uncharacterized protein n=1 Tax=Allomyces macrogynus (strain ATCC 38327) TaxID=578462 RepID=A0A0L0S778_ALLM3|nr:hypothetical protein AMAG_05081 [Allomyces macrogynus ATCC 38327]|eukprot:KNE58271.1 hypothetical protein AMAG_05081 [Allomyces macrogynus ATCC 38327]